MKQRAIIKILLGIAVFMVTLLLGVSFLTKIQSKGQAKVKKVLTKYQKRINPYVKLYGITHHDYGTKIQKVSVQSPFVNFVLNNVEINQSFVSMSALWSKLDTLKFAAKNWELSSKYLVGNKVSGYGFQCVAKTGVCQTKSDRGDINFAYRYKPSKNSVQISYHLQVENLNFLHPAISSTSINIPKLDLSGKVVYHKKSHHIQSNQNSLSLKVAQDEELKFQFGLSKNKNGMLLAVKGDENKCQSYSKLVHLFFLLKVQKRGEKYSVQLPRFTDHCEPVANSIAALNIEKKFLDFKKKKQKSRNWVPYYDVSRLLMKSVIIAEDGGFYRHDGVLEKTLISSLLRNINDQKFTLGGSTITMQTVKNYLLTKRKQITRKLYEIMASKTIEKLFSKREILEYYVNRIEFGPDIYGVKEASRFLTEWLRLEWEH